MVLAFPVRSMTKTLSQALARYAEQVRPEIDAALDRATQFGPGCPPGLAGAIRHSLLAPGKRLRPMLVLMAAEACGGDRPSSMPAAVAVEMIHAYSLIHDDLPAMDDDDLRRGRPTCHKVFGEAVAILAGDALLAMAFETLTTLDCPAQVVVDCTAAMARAAGPCHLVGGQTDDIQGWAPWQDSYDDADATEDAPATSTDGMHEVASNEESLDLLESIHQRKTGAMINVALRLGAMVAGADASQRDALNAYGCHLGLAFQITDDVLDVCGDAADVGKSVHKDLDRGKLTYPGLLGVEASLQRAEHEIDQALESIVVLGPSADPLRALARYVLERNR